MARDLVCGMTVDETKAPRSSHGGRTFYFCSPSCRAAFDRSPNEYVRLAEVVPPLLARLPELARNLWWSWHPEALELFEALKPSGDEPTHHNPLLLLLELDRQTLDTYAPDAGFLGRYRRVLAMFDADLMPRASRTHRPRRSAPGDGGAALQRPPDAQGIPGELVSSCLDEGEAFR
jgi:YHS domain-containing protein